MAITQWSSNENKMSHHWRERAWHAGCEILVMENVKAYAGQLVGSSDWLDDWLIAVADRLSRIVIARPSIKTEAREETML